EESMRRLRRDLPAGAPWGTAVRYRVSHPGWEHEVFDVIDRHAVDRIEASNYLEPTAALVRYRLAGARADGDRVVPAHRLLVRVFRPDVAERFLAPPP